VAYIASTGEITIQPDGKSIGLFDIRSDAGIFTGDAIYPPNELLPNIDTASRKIWVTQPINALTMDFSLGRISSPGLSLAFLLSDLRLIANSGFGTATLIPDLVYTIPEPATVTLFAIGIACCTATTKRHPR
jgi:hypothetical protein